MTAWTARAWRTELLTSPRLFCVEMVRVSCFCCSQAVSESTKNAAIIEEAIPEIFIIAFVLQFSSFIYSASRTMRFSVLASHSLRNSWLHGASDTFCCQDGSDQTEGDTCS